MGANQKACVHCLRVTETTKDHVFPGSWYPDNTPSTVQRWTAPSCATCNKTFGELETDLLARLIGSVDPNEVAAVGLHDKVLRSFGIGIVEELSEEEKTMRGARRAQIRSEFTSLSEVATLPGKIPGLGPPEQQGGQVVSFIPMAGLSMMAEKIARGCEYNYDKKRRRVEPPYGVRAIFPGLRVVPEVFAPFCRHFDFGPGCKLTRVVDRDDPNFVLYWILIWNTLFMHVRIDLEEELQKLKWPAFDGISLPKGKRAMVVPEYLREFKDPSVL